VLLGAAGYAALGVVGALLVGIPAAILALWRRGVLDRAPSQAFEPVD
jgi:hypothetical protein